MELVIDANVLFSALIKTGCTTELLFEERLQLFTPEFIMQEFLKYESEILKKTERTKTEFDEIFSAVKEIITVVPKEDYSKFLKKAEEISPDPNDFIYVALALRLNCPIWSNDKLLKKQDKVKVYATHEIKDLL